jgi:type II secretory pathway pseudopilin PulG
MKDNKDSSQFTVHGSRFIVHASRTTLDARRLTQGGFTLIELLIAMLILFIGLIAVAGLASTAILGNANAKWSTAATTLAEEKIEELKSKGFLGLTNTGWTSPETITLTGAGRFERQWQITTPPPGMTDINIRLIEVKVSWADRGVTREVNLATYIAR